jgi:hypothetical protein
MSTILSALLIIAYSNTEFLVIGMWSLNVPYDKTELMKARERQFTIVYKKSTHYFHYKAVPNYGAADMLEKASQPAWPGLA